MSDDRQEEILSNDGELVLDNCIWFFIVLYLEQF